MCFSLSDCSSRDISANLLLGSTFFPACKVQNAKNLPNKVVIGVNYEGIRLYKTKNKVFFSFL